MRSSRILVVLALATTLIVPATFGQASSQPSAANSIGFGSILQSNQNDFGFGAEIISPSFARDRLAVVASGTYNYITGSEWEGYGSTSLDLLAGITAPSETHRLYGTAGVVALFPSDGVSSENLVIGATGGFGFEFFFTPQRLGSYYIELGGIGTAAGADEVANSPVYANGFTTSVGVRYYVR